MFDSSTNTRRQSAYNSFQSHVDLFIYFFQKGLRHQTHFNKTFWSILPTVLRKIWGIKATSILKFYYEVIERELQRKPLLHIRVFKVALSIYVSSYLSNSQFITQQSGLKGVSSKSSGTPIVAPNFCFFRLETSNFGYLLIF